MQGEISELKKEYADPRRTEISEQGVTHFREEALIPHQRMVVPLSNRGYVKRVPARAYTLQHRGGKGIIGLGHGFVALCQALHQSGLKIHRQHPIGPGTSDEIGHQFRGNRHPSFIFAILSSIAKIGNDSGDARG